MARKRTVCERLEQRQQGHIEGDAPSHEHPDLALPFERPWGKPELAAYLGVTVSGLDKLLATGKVPPFFRAGRMVRWRPDVVRRWTEQQEQNASA